MSNSSTFTRACFLIAALVCLPPNCAVARLQESSRESEATSVASPDDELPKHAVWRWGEHGHATDSNGTYRIQFSPDGKFLATRNRENSVAIYDFKTQKQLCEVSGHENNWVESIDFSPDAKFFVTAAGSSEKIKVWSTQTGKLESEIDTDGSAAYFNESGDEIHVLGETHVETYSWPGVQLTTQRKWKSDNLTRAGMSHDGRLVVAYRTLNRQIFQTLVVDLETKSKVTLDGSNSIPKSVAISPNHLWIAIAHHRDPRVYLWDLREPSQKKYSLVKHDDTVQSLSISDDNRFLISSGWDAKVIAWDILTREPIGQFAGHDGHVNATACSPRDFLFASGASGVNDCSTIVWTMKDLLFPDVPAPDLDDFDTLWNELGASSLNSSLHATSAFIRADELFLAPLEERIRSSVSESVSESFDECLQRLTHREFEVREKATEDLIRIRGQAEARLRRVLAETTSPELRYRIGRILKTQVVRPKSTVTELRRWGRIILVLEQINSQHSRKILEAIAEGHRDIDIAREARDSLERNEQRKELVP